MIPDFKTYIKESIWSDIQDRSTGDSIRKEDIALKLVIDGVEYTFSRDFMGMGDEYNESTGGNWTAFAFNKMPNGSHHITGDTDAAGSFSSDKWELGDPGDYDVYVLKNYIDYSKEELIEAAIDSYDLDKADHIVKDILKKYVVDVFENHMSDYAQFCIFELWGSDMKNDMVISYCEGTDYSEIDEIVDEFEGQKIYDARMFLYPTIDNWYENLTKELIDVYTKEGWVKSETYGPDWDNGIPGGTMGLCFVKLTEDDEI
jgi:hypothetical protein